MGTKNKTKEYYYDKFIEHFNEGTPIVDSVTGEIYDKPDEEEFIQCYSDTPERRTFPKYWFVSKQGNLLNVCEDKLILVHKIPRVDSGKYSYKYAIPVGEDGSVTKNIEGHNLVGLVFGSEAFGVAAQKLKEEGVQSFGVRSQEGTNNQGHHVDGDDTNNDPSNIKFVTDRVHSMFDGIPKPGSSDKKELAFMYRFREIAKLENPDGITVLLPDQTLDPQTGKWMVGKGVDIVGTTKIRVSESFLRELETIINFLTEDLNASYLKEDTTRPEL